MVGDGPRGKYEPTRDLRVGEPLGDERRDLALASRQDSDRALRRPTRVLVGDPSGELLHVREAVADQPNPAGDHLREMEVVLGEAFRRPRRDEEHATSLAAERQRDGHRGAHAELHHDVAPL